MALVTSTEMFKKAYNGGYAIGAFNVNNMEIIQGITEAAAEVKAPVILQVSRGARAYANHTYLVKLVEAAVIEGAVIKLLGLDAVINGKQKSRMESGLHTILDAVDRGVMGATNGLMDGKMLAGTALSVLAIKEWRLAGLAVPGAMTLLWWAARLFGGDRL